MEIKMASNAITNKNDPPFGQMWFNGAKKKSMNKMWVSNSASKPDNISLTTPVDSENRPTLQLTTVKECVSLFVFLSSWIFRILSFFPSSSSVGGSWIHLYSWKILPWVKIWLNAQDFHPKIFHEHKGNQRNTIIKWSRIIMAAQLHLVDLN